MEELNNVLSELPDYFDKEEIKEWIEKWKEIGGGKSDGRRNC